MNAKYLLVALALAFVSLSSAERVCFPPAVSFGEELKELRIVNNKPDFDTVNVTQYIDVERAASRIDLYENGTLGSVTIYDEREGFAYLVVKGKCESYNISKRNETAECFNATRTESFMLLDVPVSKWVGKDEDENTIEYIVSDKPFAIVSVIIYDKKSLNVITFRNWENKVDSSVFQKPKSCTKESVPMKTQLSRPRSFLPRRH